MELSLDFGGSTIDAVTWEGDEILKIESFESDSGYCMPDGYDRIYVTGGKSRFLEGEEVFFAVAKNAFCKGRNAGLCPDCAVVKVSEIDAIGAGGAWLVADCKKLLVVSMGTGTCMVVVGRDGSRHIGGTGIGGGTFLGLGRELLGVKTIPELLEIGSHGSSCRVDLSVKDIVGGDIGRVSAEATASNLGRLAREVDFSREDLAAGIINLIGQSIGVSVAFAAQAEGASKVVLVGKLTRAEAITEVVRDILDGFDLKVVVPERASVAVAIGAKIAYNFSEKQGMLTQPASKWNK